MTVESCIQLFRKVEEKLWSEFGNEAREDHKEHFWKVVSLNLCEGLISPLLRPLVCEDMFPVCIHHFP